MNKYDDIINMPHYELKNHKRMTMESRAAQFAPFSALTGYSDAITETSRLVDKKIIISEDIKTVLDTKLQIIEDNLKTTPLVTVIYFIPDNNKSGGRYKEYTGKVKKIDNIEYTIIFTDKTKINLNNIFDIKL